MQLFFYLPFHHSIHSVALENAEECKKFDAEKISLFFFSDSDIITIAKPKRVGKLTVH